MITLRTATGDKAISAMTLRTPTGDKGILRATLRTPTGDKVIFDSTSGGPFTVEASPISAVGSGFVAGPVSVKTNTITVTATGGTAPYTYAWTRVSGPAGFNILSPTSNATRFAITLDQGEDATALFRCTVTDARARTGTVDVEANASNYGSL